MEVADVVQDGPCSSFGRGLKKAAEINVKNKKPKDPVGKVRGSL